MNNYKGIPNLDSKEIDFFINRGYTVDTIRDFNDLAFTETTTALQEAKNGIIKANEHLHTISRISTEKEDTMNNARKLYKEAADLNDLYATNHRAVMPVQIYTKATMARILSEEIIKTLAKEKQLDAA